MGANGQNHETSIAMADSHAALRQPLFAVLGNQEDMRVVGTALNISALVDLIEATAPSSSSWTTSRPT